MTFDKIDQKATQLLQTENYDKLRNFNKSFAMAFDSPVRARNSYYENLSSTADASINSWLNVVDEKLNPEYRAVTYKTIKGMFTGERLDNDKMSLGLNQINGWSINPEYKYANIKQHAGYAAEVISTAKENIISNNKGTGIKTWRTDDLAVNRLDLGYTKNDLYVDKVRIDANGKIVDRIQTKFVGKTAKECFNRLSSKKYEKYLDSSKVDKLEVPKDYYDEVKAQCSDKIKSLENQIEATKNNGKLDVASSKEAEFKKYKRIDEMLEKSTVTNKEAQSACMHPKIYKAQLMLTETVKVGNKSGINTAKSAASLTLAISTVDNISKVCQGEVEIDDAMVNIIESTGKSAIVGYGTGFATGALQNVMTGSSRAFIQKVGNSCLPAAAVSFAVESYDEVVEYINGDIDEYELADALGENSAKVAGGIAGAKIGATIGTAVAPGAGTAIGATAGGIVGGMVGSAVAAEAYNYAVDCIKEQSDAIKEFAGSSVETLSKKADELADAAQKYKDELINNVSVNAPQVLNDVKSAFSDFTANVHLSFSLG